jgi:hypothetical protein
MKNKRFRQMFNSGMEDILRRQGRLAGYKNYGLHLARCEFTNQLAVWNYYEQPYPTLEGYVGKGAFKIGTVSIKGKV